MDMRYDRRDSRPGEKKDIANIVILILCAAILLLTFLLLLINITRLHSLFTGGSQKEESVQETDAGDGQNVISDPGHTGGAGGGNSTDVVISDNPASGVTAEQDIEDEEEPEEDEPEEEEKDEDGTRVIDFPDQVLKDAVRSALGITRDEILVSDTYNIDSLKMENDTGNTSLIIDDLSGLSEFHDLTELKVAGFQIMDISALSEMKGLKSLELQENMIRDIRPLSGMDQLEKLNLHSNEISDLSPLQNMMSLRHLWLYNNKISDLTPL